METQQKSSKFGMFSDTSEKVVAGYHPRRHLDDIKKYAPEFVPEFIPEFVPESDLNTDFYPGTNS